ncbi:peroxiredoxin [Sphingomonas sp. DG1-23]|uniref:peroxiredoxin n=1 Tax=Sphingomonas sp. DG1-23 TaxID=3068316 RepID=UPI00273DB270|nr:peroxiredoxin [Sphingomonas sp. DG1-23]MDP5279598.1 peroxiredoxin [Sphingomonas sp. DG1-23]
MIEPGDALPAVMLEGKDGPIALAGRKRPLVLYFYPKDDTAGCTREAQDFSARLTDFAALGVDVLGVSKDNAAKHRKFSEKYELTVPLATDDGTAMEAFGVWIEKQLYGRRYMGVDRSTFLFGPDGKLVRAWRKVRVPGHVEAVLAAAKEMLDR